MGSVWGATHGSTAGAKSLWEKSRDEMREGIRGPTMMDFACRRV